MVTVTLTSDRHLSLVGVKSHQPHLQKQQLIKQYQNKKATRCIQDDPVSSAKSSPSVKFSGTETLILIIHRDARHPASLHTQVQVHKATVGAPPSRFNQ